MQLFHFYIRDTIYDIQASDAGKAMEYANRNIVDQLGLHPMAWEDMPGLANSYYLKTGDFFS